MSPPVAATPPASVAYRTVSLRTPPIELLAAPGVFDAFGWCASTMLESRLPPQGSLPKGGPIDGTNPPGMAFVFRTSEAAGFLPRELAKLHVPRLSHEGEMILAPYAIDDATDGLWEKNIEPASVMLLAADSLGALAWGLHDWAHFHNHGPFEARAETELQCDIAALVWLHVNRAALALGEDVWDELRREWAELSASRFADEGATFDRERLSARRVLSVAERALRAAS